MSKFKGTQGEWELLTQHSNNDLIGIKIVSGNDMEEVIDFGLGGYIDYVQEANAKLITCAPEMLKMLKKLSKQIEIEMVSDWLIELKDNADQLILKATE